MPITKQSKSASAVGRGKAKRQAASKASKSKAALAGRRLKRTVTGTEAASIAKDVALRSLETKFFQTSIVTGAHYPHPASGEPGTGVIVPSYNVSSLGYCTTINHEGGTGTAIMEYPGYGTSNIHQMEMLRPFPASSPNAVLGHSCTPYKAWSKWTIARGPSDMTYLSQTQGIHTGWQSNLPIRVRVVHVTPKMSPGTAVEIDPKMDLFLDEHGNHVGVNMSSFSVQKMRHAPVNFRKYTLIKDEQFVLDPQLCTETAAVLRADSSLSYNPRGILGSGKFTKAMSMSHQLTTKKGDKVRFQSTTTQDVPTTGQRREYVFFHFCWETKYTGGLLPKSATDPTVMAAPPSGGDIGVSPVFTSTFKDG